jgi:adenine-specific DNA-methyltransferase
MTGNIEMNPKNLRIAESLLDFQDTGAIRTERELIGLALGLGAQRLGRISDAEKRLTAIASDVPNQIIADYRKQILEGGDPLGESLCEIRSPELRRSRGQTFTPQVIIAKMFELAIRLGSPQEVVDPGAGSARFLTYAAKIFPNARLIAIESDPVAALLARANLQIAGCSKRSDVIVSDYRNVHLPPIKGQRLFVGNPPYIRHHLIERTWKNWLSAKSVELGLPATQLAGLHAYFFLATALIAKEGDIGVFITAAEWLEVNYGKLLRSLFLARLGGSSIHIIEPALRPFRDANTTAAVTTFLIGSTPAKIYVDRVRKLSELSSSSNGRWLNRERLQTECRWTHLTRSASRPRSGFIELGEVCRVHRGAVTGANKIWIDGPHSRGLPSSVLYPAITRAKELFNSGLELNDLSQLRRVIDIPADLSLFNGEELRSVELFLRDAKKMGATDSYIANNRKAWWSVGLREPPPILATYMARRPPAFVRNFAAARYLNIAHGLYPRAPMSEAVMTSLVNYLATNTKTAQGRTYAGGLTKFEPREMERLHIPDPESLGACAQE